MNNLKGKKLLILGSTSRTIDLVNYAKEMGVYTIVTDWNDPTKAPVKMEANEHWEISLLDYDELSKRIKEHNVEGIITGFTDSYLLPYQHLCELNNLPCYATKEMFETTLDKARFKKLCIDNGVPVVPEYKISTIDIDSISKENKILIKPVDNSGSRGIIVCDSPQTFQDCLNYALSYSKKKEVVIEKYMELDTFSVSYTIQNGQISMSTMNDRIVHKAEGAGAVTAGGRYPSRYIDSYMLKMDSKVQNMYKKLGVENGVLFIQGFTDGDKYFFYEMGYRISGGRHYIYTDHQNNTNAAKNLINFALTGRMADYVIKERDTPRFRDLCLQINILGKESKIAKIEGLDYIKSMPEVFELISFKTVGDEIGKDGTTSQQLIGIYTVVKDEEHLASVCKKIKEHLIIEDTEGNNLILELLS